MVTTKYFTFLTLLNLQNFKLSFSAVVTEANLPPQMLLLCLGSSVLFPELLVSEEAVSLHISHLFLNHFQKTFPTRFGIQGKNISYPR